MGILKSLKDNKKGFAEVIKEIIGGKTVKDIDITKENKVMSRKLKR